MKSSLHNAVLLVMICCAISICGAWRHEPTTGDKPLNRGGGQMQILGHRAIVFAGFNECFNGSECQHVFYNDIHELNLNTMTWELVETIEDAVHGKPEPRAFFGSVVYEQEEAIIYYGGTAYPVLFDDWYTYPAVTFGDVWFYYPATRQWKYIPVNEGAESPGPRSGSGIQVRGKKLIMVGGIYTNTFQSFEDTWELDLKKSSRSWVKIATPFSDTAKDNQVGRYIFPFVAKNNNNMYLFSGNIIPFGPLLGEQHQDAWQLRWLFGFIPVWTPLTFAANHNNEAPFTGVVHGGGAIVNNRFITFFGDNNDNEHECYTNSASEGQSPVDTTFSLHLNAWFAKWNQVEFSYTNEAPPLKRIFFSNDEGQEKVFVYGGFNVDCTGDFEVIWNNELYSLDWNQI